MCEKPINCVISYVKSFFEYFMALLCVHNSCDWLEKEV